MPTLADIQCGEQIPAPEAALILGRNSRTISKWVKEGVTLRGVKYEPHEVGTWTGERDGTRYYVWKSWLNANRDPNRANAKGP